MRRVFIIHGWEGSPSGNWFPWLKRELEARGVEAHVPAMPDSMHPTPDGWQAAIAAAVGLPSVDDYFVGHSLGAVAALRYLESLPVGAKVGGAILVAGFAEPIQYEELRAFYAPLDDSKINAACGRFVVIHADDDPYVPLSCGEHLRDRFGAEFIIVPGGKHLNAEDGYLTLPVVLERLEMIMR